TASSDSRAASTADSLMGASVRLRMRQLLHRADFDDCDTRRRKPRGHRARLVDVLGLYQKKSTELLRRLGEWTVRGGDRAAPDPDGPRGPRRLQRVRDDVVAAAPDLVVVVERGIDQGLHLHLGQGLEHVLVVVD